METVAIVMMSASYVMAIINFVTGMRNKHETE